MIPVYKILVNENNYPKSWTIYWRYDPEVTKIIKNKYHTLLPTVTQIIKTWVPTKKDGIYWSYAGRCYDIAGVIYHSMKQLGYDNMKVIDSTEYERTGRPDKILRYLINTQSYNHAWIYYKGMHYDAMNPEGVPNPKFLEFFKYAYNNIKLNYKDIIKQYEN